MRTVLAPLAAVVVVVAAGALGCQSKVDRAGQQSAGFYAPNVDVLWDVAKKEMARAGYAVDAELSDRPNKSLVSRWNTNLQPFSGRGTREQATVRLVEIPGKTGYWSIECNVIQQRNMNLKAPTNPGRAEWTDGERLAERERQIIHGIESFFVGYDVSDRFRSTYGMPAGRGAVAPGPLSNDTKDK